MKPLLLAALLAAAPPTLPSAPAPAQVAQPSLTVPGGKFLHWGPSLVQTTLQGSLRL